jgi:hypothetical protein
MNQSLQIACPALAARFSAALEIGDVDLALGALRNAMREAATMERCGRSEYREMPDHRTRSWAAVQFFRIVGLIAPQQVKVSGSVGHIHAGLDELIEEAAGVGRQMRAADIVREYLPPGARSLEVPERDEVVPIEA